MQIDRVAILLIVQQSYGMRGEAVEEPFGPRLGTPVPLAVRKQRQHDLGDCFDNFLGLPLTPPIIYTTVQRFLVT